MAKPRFEVFRIGISRFHKGRRKLQLPKVALGNTLYGIRCRIYVAPVQFASRRKIIHDQTCVGALNGVDNCHIVDLVPDEHNSRCSSAGPGHSFCHLLDDASDQGCRFVNRQAHCGHENLHHLGARDARHVFFPQLVKRSHGLPVFVMSAHSFGKSLIGDASAGQRLEASDKNAQYFIGKFDGRIVRHVRIIDKMPIRKTQIVAPDIVCPVDTVTLVGQDHAVDIFIFSL